ncbi:hypothetical protein [Subtercola boreus]|uniref:DUF4352 domain-containing protein n=1 Tax=Subtercola boreus TaxID=120213 RepID=A0A3E0WB00_9MICO|nr:hypothetical protein [Subtercola boreus]RFA21188.1 hypothetical protein B7R24_07300 [Subtercola boreus]RFA21571.1 hypothetical protein B7R23_07245 [Subtercola boreus]RFA27541.1 hypothetical protein B7R25_07370 [Subtercola boreus]
MASHASTPPLKTGPGRGLIAGIAIAVVVVVIIVVAVIVASVNAGSTPAPAGDSNSQGQDAGGSALPADSAGAPSVAGPTADAGDPAQPVEQAPVPLDSPAPVAEGVSVAVSDVTSVDGVANGVGEVGGPSLSFTVSVTNSSSASVSLQTAVVGLTYGANQTPSNELVSASTGLTGDVAAGATVTGRYVFVVPTEDRDAVRITLDYRAGSPVAVFEGAAPR